ncbi:hypothetical protein [Haladaptatus sp. R4]|uniref:hypothetical protein n=1 Tax=Haladaptatus sp. R4 TaxID=1679489 RepID=UPI001CBAFA37|nr:hypothetical protein [Haladaptatus sp. R4]
MKERQVRAAVVTEQSDGFHIEELSIDEPSAGEVLVRIARDRRLSCGHRRPRRWVRNVDPSGSRARRRRGGRSGR